MQTTKQFRDFLPRLVRHPIDALTARLWGYDFFISYHWDSGGKYATSLAQKLQGKYDIFLDRAEYAAGVNWLKEGRTALDRSKAVLLIATDKAVRDSEPVRKEIEYFAAKSSNAIIPIIFKELECGNRKHTTESLLDLLPANVLYIEEESHCLESGPSEEAISRLLQRAHLMRRKLLRQVIVVVVVCFILAAALISMKMSNDARIAAINQQIEQESRAFAESRGSVDPEFTVVTFAESPSAEAIRYVNRVMPNEVTCKLAGLPQLNRETLQNLVSISGLQTLLLELANTEVAPDAFHFLQDCQELQILVVKDGKFGDHHAKLQHMEAISRCSSLRALAIANSQLESVDIVPITGLPLTTLSLVVNNLNPDCWQTLAKLTDLRVLHLGSNLSILDSPPPVEIAAQFQSLEELSINSQFASLTSEACHFLAELPAVEELNLSFTFLDQNGLEQLASAEQLRLLSLIGSEVSCDNVVKAFGNVGKPLEIAMSAADIQQCSGSPPEPLQMLVADTATNRFTIEGFLKSLSFQSKDD